MERNVSFSNLKFIFIIKLNIILYSKQFIFKFLYKAILDNNLIENELDHIFIGTSDAKPNINVNEVCDYKYICEYELNLLIEKEHESFTPWFKECYKKVFKMFNHHNNIKSEILI